MAKYEEIKELGTDLFIIFLVFLAMIGAFAVATFFKQSSQTMQTNTTENHSATIDYTATITVYEPREDVAFLTATQGGRNITITYEDLKRISKPRNSGEELYEALRAYEDYIVFDKITTAYADIHEFNDTYNCVNYSKDLTSLDLLRRLGFDVTIKTGYNDDYGHAWNKVCFDWESQDARFARYSEKYPYAYNPYQVYKWFGDEGEGGRS